MDQYPKRRRATLGALAGLGGCAFAPGTSGNTATEDLLFALRPHWLTPAVFGDIVTAANQLLMLLGEPNRSKAAHGARLCWHRVRMGCQRTAFGLTRFTTVALPEADRTVRAGREPVS